ncbi:MAG: hypothetical protein Q4F57_10010 [Weeksellaceae bacterium]|nr:hypothetical protein [Weeksellaceae bacterium]
MQAQHHSVFFAAHPHANAVVAFSHDNNAFTISSSHQKPERMIWN